MWNVLELIELPSFAAEEPSGYILYHTCHRSTDLTDQMPLLYILPNAML